MTKSDSDPEQPQPLSRSEAPDLRPYEIPVEGSLGLLAVGYRGLIAWREKRAQATAQADRKSG